MTQLVTGERASSGHQHYIGPARQHSNERARSSASQTQMSDPDQMSGVGGKSINGPINLLVKAALGDANGDDPSIQRNPPIMPADQPAPAPTANREMQRRQSYPHTAHEQSHAYAVNHAHDYGQYADVPRQAPNGSDRSRLQSGPPHHGRDPRDDDPRYASHQGNGWMAPGPPPPPPAYEYHHPHAAPPPAHPHPHAYYGPGYHQPHPYPPHHPYHHDGPWQGPPHGARHDWQQPDSYYRSKTTHSSEDYNIQRHSEGAPGGSQAAERSKAPPASPQKRYREMSNRSSSSVLEEPSGSSKTVSSTTGSSDEYMPTTKRTRANPARTTRASARLRANVKEESPETTTPESMGSTPGTCEGAKIDDDGDGEDDGEGGGDGDGDGEGDGEVEDADGDEEKPKPKRRKYVRRDQARRKEQNAQAQKKFRQKKKKLAEQMKADLEDSQRQLAALEADLAHVKQHVSTLEKENEHLRTGLIRCKCSCPDAE